MMKRKRKLFFAAIILLALWLTAPACYAAPGFDDQEIRIAQWGPQTGPAAPWGVIARGSGLVFDLANEEGGIHGRKIKYFMRDDQYNPAQTKTVVKELIDKYGIFAFVGGVGSSTGMAVKDYITQNKIIWVSPAAYVKEFVFPPNPYIFGVYFPYEDEASILTKYIVEKLKIKKIAFFYQNDSYGLDGLAGCKKRLEKYKIKLVAEIPMEPTEKDMASQILKLKNSGAEAVIGWLVPTPAVIALKTSATVGFKPQWVFPSTLANYPLMHKITGGLWEGVITGLLWEPADSNKPEIVSYREAAKRLTPDAQWGTFYMAGITYAEPLVYALKRVGRNLSTEALLQELNLMNKFQGIGPAITWTPTRHQGTDACMIGKCGPNGTTIKLQDWTQDDLATWKNK